MSMKKLIAIFAVAIVAACSKTQPPAVPKAAAATKPAAANSNQISGKVAETFNGGGYTYLRITTDRGDEWAAIPETKIAQGDPVTVDVQMMMEKFQSKALNRTFDRIAFASLAGRTPPPATAQQHMQVPEADVHVERAPGGKTVAEIWAEKKELSGKDVVVRGQVVKFLPEIMGTNWIHIQDGSGSKGKGDNDLSLTTNEVVKKGDIITVKGKLATDKDVGAGYFYPVIIEKATIQRTP
jgi:hypothetical protein